VESAYNEDMSTSTDHTKSYAFGSILADAVSVAQRRNQSVYVVQKDADQPVFSILVGSDKPYMVAAAWIVISDGFYNALTLDETGSY